MRNYARNNKSIVSIDKETGNIVKYLNQFQASLLGFNTSKIGTCCKNHQLTHKNKFWLYLEDFNETSYSTCLNLNTAPRRKKTPYRNEKECSKCKQVKTLVMFSPSKQCKFGVDSICKKCRSTMAQHRIKTNIKTKLCHNLRHRLRVALTRKKLIKKTGFNALIGCDLDQLKHHIESQFTKEMTWDNYGTYWEIDHIRTFYSAKTQAEVHERCHFANLRPLTIAENRSRRKEG